MLLKDLSDTLQTLNDKKDAKNPTQRAITGCTYLKTKHRWVLNVQDGL